MEELLKVPYTEATHHPEGLILLTCIRKDLQEEGFDTIKTLIQSHIDWSYLIQKAEHHGLIPALYGNLSAHFREIVPKDVMNEIEEHFRNNVFRNLFLTAELFKILKCFETKGIVAIPYKGPTLAILAFDDISSRQFDDLDILIRKEDVFVAKEILISMGYRPEFDLPQKDESIYLKSTCEYNFDLLNDGIHVELHWEFVPKFLSVKFDMENILKHLHSVVLLGKPVLTFSPEDLFIILCVHYGCKHYWGKIGWIYDMANLLETHQGIHLESLLVQARHMGILRVLLLGLFLTSHLTKLELPQKVWQGIESDDMLKKLLNQVTDNLFKEDENDLGVYEDRFFYLKLRENIGDKIRYFFRRMFIPNIDDLSFIKLPPYVTFLYYLIRPLRLSANYAFGFFGK